MSVCASLAVRKINRRVDVLAPYNPEDFIAVYQREHDIENNEVIVLLNRQMESILAVYGYINGEAVFR